MSFEKKLNSLKKKRKIKNKNKLGLKWVCYFISSRDSSAWLKFQTFIWLNDSLIFRF